MESKQKQNLTRQKIIFCSGEVQQFENFVADPFLAFLYGS